MKINQIMKIAIVSLVFLITGCYIDNASNLNIKEAKLSTTFKGNYLYKVVDTSGQTSISVYTSTELNIGDRLAICVYSNDVWVPLQPYLK